MTTQSLIKPSVPSSRFLSIVATLLSIPFLSFYWMALSHFIPDAMMAQRPDWMTPLSVVLYLPFAFFTYLLFGNPYVRSDGRWKVAPLPAPEWPTIGGS